MDKRLLYPAKDGTRPLVVLGKEFSPAGRKEETDVKNGKAVYADVICWSDGRGRTVEIADVTLEPDRKIYLGRNFLYLIVMPFGTFDGLELLDKVVEVFRDRSRSEKLLPGCKWVRMVFFDRRTGMVNAAMHTQETAPGAPSAQVAVQAGNGRIAIRAVVDDANGESKNKLLRREQNHDQVAEYAEYLASFIIPGFIPLNALRSANQQ
jgi:hypothetical protein